MGTWTVPSYAEGWTVPGYTEQRELGRGASGRVAEAVHDASGRRVAIKYLSADLVRDQSFLWEFRAVAQRLMEVTAPQVARVHDYAEQPGQGAAVVMELIDGAALREMIRRQGPLEPEAALTVLREVLLALGAAHRAGFGHRACTPGNVLVSTEGEVKLTDFGMAVPAARQAPPGPPHYLAPEQWNGGPSSPATDIYAATAVFFECLAGGPPYTGSLTRLREQHEGGAVPADRVAARLRGLVARGMTADPAARPHDAAAFAAELEALAARAYGPDWEQRGRGQLARRAAALAAAPGDRRASAPGASRWRPLALRGGGRRGLVAITSAVAAAVLVAGGATAAVTLRAETRSPALLAGSSSAAGTAARPSYEAVANVTPPVATSKCNGPAPFAFSGTLTATAPGTVKYQWVYSSGRQGPVQAVTFTGAGQRAVPGEAARAGGGWAEIKVVSPVTMTSDKATYKLLCGGGAAAGGITATAAVQAPSTAVTCGTAPPSVTATGSVKAPRAEQVSYYWVQSDGRDSAPATLTFTGPGTLAVTPLKIIPPGDSGTSEAVLVVTSPVTTASGPASYTLACTAPQPRQAASPAGSARSPAGSTASAAGPAASSGSASSSGPAGSPASPVSSQGVSASVAASPVSTVYPSCSSSPLALTISFTGTITDDRAGSVSFHWVTPAGNQPEQTLHFSQPGSLPVSADYLEASDTASGSASIVVTSPVAVTSNAAAFSVACGQVLTLIQRLPSTVTTGQPYAGTVTVTGGTGTYTWSSVSGLPAGLAASASGARLTISGTPTSAGSFYLAIAVHDSATPQDGGAMRFALSVRSNLSLPGGGSLPSITAGVPYSGTVTATGGTGPYRWSASGLPAGLAINPVTGTIGGTATQLGANSGVLVEVTVTDSESPPQFRTAAYFIPFTPPPLSIQNGALPAGRVGAAYVADLYTATVDAGTATWSVSGLPPGLSVNPVTGAISGTPTTAGSFPVTVTARTSVTVSKAFTLVIDPA